MRRMTIHNAVTSGDPMVVECIIDTRPDVIEHRNTLGRTALMQAAAIGQYHIVKLLSMKGAKIDLKSYRTDNESLAIHLAADNGYVEIIDYLLQLDSKLLEVKDKDGDTPLSRAAYNGQDMVVKDLLEKGANIEAPGYRDRTPLLRSAANGHLTTVKLLLSHGAIITAKSNFKDFEKNAVNLAAVFGHVRTVEYLLTHEPNLITERNIHGDTQICYAALGGHVPVIELFLKKYNADIETIGRSGRTPLLQSASMGHLSAVRYLVNQGANIFAISDKKDKGQNALHLASRFGHPSVVEFLASAEPTLVWGKDEEGRTPFDIAKANGKKDVLIVLNLFLSA